MYRKLNTLDFVSLSNGDWSEGDWTGGNKMQQRWDNSSLFPVVLEENKIDASINSTFEDVVEARIQKVDVESHDDLELFVTSNNDYVTTCKTEAQQRNPSLQDDKDKDGDGPSVVINNLRREASIGCSILSLLNESGYAECGMSSVLDNGFTVSA